MMAGVDGNAWVWKGGGSGTGFAAGLGCQNGLGWASPVWPLLLLGMLACVAIQVGCLVLEVVPFYYL